MMKKQEPWWVEYSKEKTEVEGRVLVNPHNCQVAAKS
jgi:hypothetical protein